MVTHHRNASAKRTGPFWLSWCHLKPLFGFTINKSVESRI
jgi:hypothetical protein